MTRSFHETARIASRCAIIFLIGMAASAHAGGTFRGSDPEPAEDQAQTAQAIQAGDADGVIGWSYYNPPFGWPSIAYAADPVTACKNSARNHMHTSLVGMRRTTDAYGPKSSPGYLCKYGTSFYPVSEYTPTFLFCKQGYVSVWPGICVRKLETSTAPSCSPNAPGYRVGNPTILSSGAKVREEMDLASRPSGQLGVARTYRSQRHGTDAQSGGLGWSFWFDRAFHTDTDTLNKAPATVWGIHADGSYFKFSHSNGAYLSRQDKQDVLIPLSTAFDDWLLIRQGIRLDRFFRVNGKFLLVSSQDWNGNGEWYSYDTELRVASVSDGHGRKLEVEWQDKVVARISNKDLIVRYRYDSAGVDEGAVENVERLVGVDFSDAQGHVVASRSYQYEHPSSGYLLTGITDETGRRYASYTYDGEARVVVAEHADGANRHQISYPSEERRIVTDPIGTTRSFAINYRYADGAARVTSQDQPAGAGCSAGSKASSFAEDGTLKSSTDFNGNKSCHFNEPARGLETGRVEGLSAASACPASSTAAMPAGARRINTKWHPDWPLKTGIAAPGSITTYVYNGQADQDGQPLYCADGALLPNGKPRALLCKKMVRETSDSQGALGFAAATSGQTRVWRYRHNQAGQLLEQYEPGALDTPSASYTYYADSTATHGAGDMETSTNAAGEVTRYLEYSSSGFKTKILFPNGTTVSQRFDSRNHLVEHVVEASGDAPMTTAYARDANGLVRKVTAADGSFLNYDYDGAHRLTTITDMHGNAIHLKLNGNGNVTHYEVRDASGKVVRNADFEWDALGRVERESHGDAALKMSHQYDREGNTTAIIDGLGSHSQYAYDQFNRMIRESLPPATPGAAPTVTDLAYNALQALTRVTDPRRLTTTYKVDGFGQQIGESSPDRGDTVGKFDTAGELATSRDARGVTTSYKRDAAGRLTQIGYPSGADVHFEYGRDGGAAGKVTAMTDPSGKTSYAYDSLSRLVGKTVAIGERQFSMLIAYGRDGGGTGHVASTTYPSGVRVLYQYGNDGQAAGVRLSMPGAPSEVALISDIGYVPFGPAESWTWGGDSHRHAREFDKAGRLTKYPLGPGGAGGAVRTLTYDSAGRIMAYSHQGGLGAKLDQRFAYDSLGRLIQFDGGGSTQKYTYDPNGNRTAITLGSAAHANTYSASSNRLSATTGPFPPKRNSYDAAGNLLSDGTYFYTYNQQGRMAAVTSSGRRTIYLYNGIGQRVGKNAAAGVRTYFMYDESGRLIGEYDDGGRPVQETVYLGDMPVAVLKPGANGGGTDVYRVYADHLNAPRLITRSADGVIAWRWDDADPFGQQQPNENPSGNGKLTYNLRFPGQYFDKETNLHYNYFRDYDPQTGRYLQSDPIGLAGGINTYGYVEGNPVSKTDPMGQQAVIPVIPPPVGVPGGGTPATPGADPYSPSLPGTRYFWPKVIRDAAQSFIKMCKGDEDEETARCKKALTACRIACTPGMSKGSDVPGAYRKCVRSCMEGQGCYDF